MIDKQNILTLEKIEKYDENKQKASKKSDRIK